tara:strand:- start:497 stop:658 length:162 start_codon:yes stop_codon:yes gene_type:complete
VWLGKQVVELLEQQELAVVARVPVVVQELAAPLEQQWSALGLAGAPQVARLAS